MLKKLLIGLVLFFSLAFPARAVDYYLPYPGILPDHPFYWLKMIRDRVQLVLTTNQQAKAERLLHYADKRLGAGWALVEGNKTALGLTTLTKAEKYLDQAVSLGQGSNLEEKLKKAVLKHEEVLLRLEPQTAAEYKETVATMLVRLGQLKADLVSELEAVQLKIAFGRDEVVNASVSGQTAFAVLEQLSQEKNWPLQIKEYDFGILVEAVNGFKNTTEKAWIYYLNGVSGKVAADKQPVKAGDLVEWRYEKPIY